MLKTIGISLPKEIIEQIDSDRGDINRSRYILRLIESKFHKKGDNILNAQI